MAPDDDRITGSRTTFGSSLLLKEVGNRGRDFAGSQHPDPDGGNLQVVSQGCEDPDYQIGIEGLDAEHPLGRLDGQGGNAGNA